jgi:AraC family transcriptional regulator
MSHLEATLTAVQFIETHLQEEIKVADIADAVHFSLFYFCRIFNQTAHHSPYDYLMRRRLSEAARLLTDPAQRITDVAFAYRFGSPESFSRAFRRMFGCLPSQWPQDGPGKARLLLTPLTAAHLTHRAQMAAVRPRLAEEAARRVMGLMSLLPEGETAVSLLWQRVAQILGDVGQPVYAITDFPGPFTMAAVACAETCQPPLPLVCRLLPAATYASFSTPNSATARQLMTDYIYQTWLPQSGFALAFPLEVAQFAAWERMDDPETAVVLSIPVNVMADQRNPTHHASHQER